ncbi:hypothetical protein ALP10_03300 [Pseudomonas syringae pv. helianthi]|uniref:Uncharacterized protein n=1 Tax=Pseudomonas syringae pv. helianthi TaxID=251654 RepID=A0A3M6CK03_9PSED|nr:hypothetical protein [Pseudomonas syringae group genomosp. 7]RMV43761.1 hypothetical protein ALP10_03300 [Pseudomonas syringae pv. helianthi]
MHIQVITGEGWQGATKQLKHLKELHDWIGEAKQLVHAEAYSAAGLVEILEVRSATKQELLVLECSRDQIQAVLEWQSETEDLVDLEYLVIHLVRRAGLQP